MIEDFETKAGYITLIGRPNSGKSTLLNSILKTKLSIVSPKPQTTRKRVMGIFTDEESQMIFLDTPGLLDPKYGMQRSMMGFVNDSIEEADILVVVADLEKYNESYFNDRFLETLKSSEAPKILVLNKIDTFKDSKQVLPILASISQLGLFDEMVPISALKNENVHNVKGCIKKYLPESPFFYDPEQLSTQPERFFISELVREKVFNFYGKEIPFSSEVVITEFKERDTGKWYISADIVVERNSQKIILIGKDGEKIKKVGQNARLEIEDHLQEEVFLELFVKVRKDWRNNPTYLRSFGY